MDKPKAICPFNFLCVCVGGGDNNNAAFKKGKDVKINK